MTKLQEFSVRNKTSKKNSLTETNPEHNYKHLSNNDAVKIPIPLKQVFRKNGIGYKLIKRNNELALFALSTDKHWEIDRIYVSPAWDSFGKHFPEAETISSNEIFGKDGSRTFQNFEKALKYFDNLSKKLGGKKTEDLRHLGRQRYSDTTQGEKVPCANPADTLYGKISPDNKLKETFKKNGLVYKLIERNDKVGFYETYVRGELCGFEVARIHNEPEYEYKGKHYPAKEALPNNNNFGLEGSKCFFAGELKRARRYFEALTDEL